MYPTNINFKKSVKDKEQKILEYYKKKTPITTYSTEKMKHKPKTLKRHITPHAEVTIAKKIKTQKNIITMD